MGARSSDDVVEQVYALATELGIDKRGADRLIERAGDVREARRRLVDRKKRREYGVLHRHDQALADEESARRREAFESGQSSHSDARARAREQQPIGARLDRVLAEFAALSVVGAGALEPSRGQPDSCAPPLVDQPELAPRLRVIEHHVSELEYELDAARGLVGPRVWRRMSAAEKDALIVNRFAGVHKDQLARDVPELGSARTIARARHRADKRQVDGTDLRPDAA